MNTMQFAADRAAIPAEADKHRSKAMRFYQAHLIALNNHNEATDPVVREWFGAMAESYADKSDNAFARALQMAREAK